MSSDVWDAHTHIDADVFASDREAVLKLARESGVSKCVIAGVKPDTWDLTQQVAAQFGFPYSLGIHPWHVNEFSKEQFNAALYQLKIRTMSALGEVGLDRRHAADGPSWQLQLERFRAQLEVAVERRLPVVIHCVRAHSFVLDILLEPQFVPLQGMIHAWSGAPEMAKRFTDRGFMLSFGPLVLNERATRARQSARQVPLSHLLVETDCPDTPLASHTRGTPCDVIAVIQEIAQLRDESPVKVADATRKNAERLFQISRL